MARRRAVGNALYDVGNLLMEFSMRRKLAQEDDQRQIDRQRELVRTNNQARVDAREDAQSQEVLKSLLGDPTGQKAQMMVDAGETKWAPYVPTGDVASTRFADTFRTAKSRTELPTDVGVETGLRASPGGRDASKDPRVIQDLIAQRNARSAAFDTEDTTQTRLQGERAFAEGENRQMGTNKAVEAFAPTARGIKVAEERALSPILVSRAGQVATAQQAAQTAGERARIEQGWELAAKDPVVAGMAQQVIAGTPIKDVPAAHRGQVMAALQSTKFAPQARVKSKEILDIGWNALQRMKNNPSGMEGFTGNVLGDPLSRNIFTGTPIGGSPAADFGSNFEQFRGALTLDKIDFLRGMGHMSDADRAVLERAATHLNSLMGTPAFDSGLKEAEAALLRSYQKLGIEPPGGAPVPPALDSGRAKLGTLKPPMNR